MNDDVKLIAVDFDHARQAMLAEFRALIGASPEHARTEIDATRDAMQQLLALEVGNAG